MTFQDYLKCVDACTAACEWAKDKSWEEVYATCHRGDWLCWLFVRTNPYDLQALTLVKGLQANEVRHLMRDPRSIAAVDAAIAYGRGEISVQQLNAADAAAYAAYADAADADADATYAAYAAAAAADAAVAVAAYAAAVAAADAAVAADDAAYAAHAHAAAHKKSLRRSADIFRENIPYEKINRVWETM